LVSPYIVFGRRRSEAGRVRAEGSDGAGDEDPGQTELAAGFENVVRAVHVDGPGQLGILFAVGRENRGQVVNRLDPVFFDDVLETVGPGHVQVFKWTSGSMGGKRLDVGGDDVFNAVPEAEGLKKLGADLARCSGDKNTTFRRCHGCASV
jgi:hypothetical protein